MSVELIDKGVSTKDLNTEYVEEKEDQDESSREKEEKKATDFGKLEAVLSALMENKVISIRECSKHGKEKRSLLSRFRTNSEGGDNAQSDTQKNSYQANSSSTITSSCRHLCQHAHSRRSIIPCEPDELQKFKTFLDYPQRSLESDSSQHLSPLYPQQLFDSYDNSHASKYSESCYCKKDFSKTLDKSRLSVQKCLPKKLATHQWLYSTSRQASTETATTSSGYISPASGPVNKRYHSIVSESNSQKIDGSNDTTNDVDNETVIEISRIKPSNGASAVEEVVDCEKMGDFAGNFECSVVNENRLCDRGLKWDETCFTTMPPCHSTPYLPSSCRNSMQEDPKCCSIASYRHSHPSGGHYVSCCNSPSYSVHSKFRYDENYLALAMNLEDLEFEEEEERRKRRKRKKKRRKERQARARGLMADELKNVQKTAKVVDPEDLPKRARWTIVATACLLLLMSMLLVGVTLRMAPIIDEMVRKENEEMLNSLNRHGTFKVTASSNASKATTAAPAAPAPASENSSYHVQ